MIESRELSFHQSEQPVAPLMTVKPHAPVQQSGIKSELPFKCCWGCPFDRFYAPAVAVGPCLGLDLYAALREEDFEELNVEISNMDWVSHAGSEPAASVGEQFSPEEMQQGLLEVLSLVPR